MQTAARAEGVAAVLTAEDGSLAHSLAEPTAALVAAVQRKCAGSPRSCPLAAFHATESPSVARQRTCLSQTHRAASLYRCSAMDLRCTTLPQLNVCLYEHSILHDSPGCFSHPDTQPARVSRLHESLSGSRSAMLLPKGFDSKLLSQIWDASAGAPLP